MKKILLLLAIASNLAAIEITNDKKRETICELFKIGAIKTGEFKLKSGITSPIYIDMRCVISYPKLFRSVVDLMAQQIADSSYDHIVGVPYAALPFASGIALLYEKSMIMPRKEVKDHGTRRAIEGVYSAGQCAIIIEDVITTGSSVLEIVEILNKEDIHVHDVVVFIDREQGGKQALAQHGITVHHVCTISQLLAILHDTGHVSGE